MRFTAVVLLLFVPLFASAAVFVNEIAWMGTSISSSNEWIELVNSGNEQISLEGWILSIEGKKDIPLAGSVSGNGFYLIERTDDVTVPTITADLVSSFGSGLSNAGAALSLKDASGSIVDRVDGSQAWLIGGNQAGDNTTKDTAQRGPSAWFTGVPTPRAKNLNTTAIETPSSLDAEDDAVVNTTTPPRIDVPVEPQIFTDAGPATLTVSTGATVIFLGRVWGLKKEPIENARMVWTFGDGGIADGASVAHTFYYPGEYTVVLNAASGFYAASDRIRVTAVTPAITLRAGGDSARSFVALENRGDDELDLSSWQIENLGKKFIIPKNTFVTAKKTLIFPSEITGLVSPEGSDVLLNFPNGTRVGSQAQINHPPSLHPVAQNNVAAKTVVQNSAPHTVVESNNQEASISDAFLSSELESLPKETGSWPWYTGAAFLGIVALFGVRFIQQKEERTTFSAADFEIIEEIDNTEPH